MITDKQVTTLQSVVVNPVNERRIQGTANWVFTAITDIPVSQQLSGGHNHYDNRRPAGCVSAASGPACCGTPAECLNIQTVPSAPVLVEENGAALTFVSPNVAGTVAINLSLHTPDGRVIGPYPGLVDVRSSDDFIEIPSSQDGTWTLAGALAEHRQNHWGQADFVAEMLDLFNDFKAEFPQAQVSINDVSLPWGGRFDLGASFPQYQTWNPPHCGHLGNNMDISNRLPRSQQQWLRTTGADRGFHVDEHPQSNPTHFHIQ